MKSITQSLAAVSIAFVASTSAVFASPIFNVPEPGSLALVGLAVAGAVAVARKK